jgi:hypothetical protein
VPALFLRAMSQLVCTGMYVNLANMLRHSVGAQLGNSCSQTRLFQSEKGLLIRRKFLGPMNRTWDDLVCKTVLLTQWISSLGGFLSENIFVAHTRLNGLPPSDNTRSVEAKQLDDGIGDTFVSVGRTSEVQTLVLNNASESARTYRG